MMTQYANVDLEHAIEKGNDHLYHLGAPSPAHEDYQTSDSDIDVDDQEPMGIQTRGRPSLIAQRRPSLHVQAFSNELLSNARKSEIHSKDKASILPLTELGLSVESTRPRLSPSISVNSECSQTSHNTDTLTTHSGMSMNTPVSTQERMKEMMMAPINLDGDLNTTGFQVHRQPSPMHVPEGFEGFRTPEGSDDESLDGTFLLGDREPSFSEQISMAEAQLRALALKGRPILGPTESVESAVQADLRDRAFEKHKRKFNTRLFKTEMCRSFTEFGICPYGPRCQFAHGKHEMRNRYRHKRHKTIKCKNFQAGYCPYGSRCCFIHEENDVQLKFIQSQAEQQVASMRPKPHLNVNRFYRHATIRARSHSPSIRRGYHSMPLPVAQVVQASE